MKAWAWVLLGGVGILGGIQLVRVPKKTNPPSDPSQSVFARMSVPEDVAAILKRACWDCHSNETVWPWYADVAPMMWTVRGHVVSGRAHLNFSEWGKYSPEGVREILEELCKLVQRREMPPPSYLRAHKKARLSDADTATLCQWAGNTAEKTSGHTENKPYHEENRE